MGLVEGFEVAGIGAETLTAHGRIGKELPRRVRILHLVLDFAANELRRVLVGLGAEPRVAEGPHKEKPPELPVVFELRLALLRGGLEHGALIGGMARPETHKLLRIAGPKVGVVGLDGLLQRPVEGLVLRGHGMVRGALEYRQAFRLLRDQGNGLDARGARANHGNSLPGEIHPFLGPASGVIDRARVGVRSGDIGDVGHG